MSHVFRVERLIKGACCDDPGLFLFRSAWSVCSLTSHAANLISLSGASDNTPILHETLYPCICCVYCDSSGIIILIISSISLIHSLFESFRKYPFARIICCVHTGSFILIILPSSTDESSQILSLYFSCTYSIQYSISTGHLDMTYS